MVVTESSGIESKTNNSENALSKSVNETQIQMQEGKVDMGKALDDGSVITESNRIKSDKQDTSSKSANGADTEDTVIKLINDQEPLAKVQLTAPHNVVANEPHHSEQSEPIYDTYLLEKTVENANLKAQIQEKVFTNVALKNKLRKLKGNSVDTEFAKSSILGKPVLQPPRNQSVVRQPNAFKSERPNFSKPRFASQVDVNNVLSKPVTQHYFPKGRESAFAKPNHMIASSSSRNSSKNMPRFSSNDMLHNHYLEEAQKKTQEKDRNSKSSVMHSTRLQNTTNDHKPKPRRNNQTTRCLPVSKSSCATSKVVPKADHFRNSSPFSDFKHFVCSTCQKCVFSANHDVCITKFLKEVNSRVKVQSPKTRNSNKPVEPKNQTQKPVRQIVTGHRFSPNKSSAVHEKLNTPRSCLRWIPTGRIFNTVGLRWVPTGKIFTSSTTKVDCEPLNGSNEDITNPYECNQTLNVSTSTLNLSADNTSGPAPQRKERYTLQCALSSKEEKSSLPLSDPCALSRISEQGGKGTLWYVLWKPSRDFIRPLGPPSGLKGLLHTLNATVIPTKLYRRTVEIFEMVDVAQRSRLGAWLRACCLFIFLSKSRGVFRLILLLSLNFISLMYNRDIVQIKWGDGSRIIT
ncbi:hypothetical protein Tco_0357123 [Tanacetum coccineum]